MSDLERVIKVIDWLIFEGYIKNKRDLADKIGYTESSLSQILNSKVSLSSKFINKLCSINDNINKLWVENGEGSMIVQSNTVSEPLEIYAKIDPWAIIKSQQETINRLTDMLYEQNKKVPGVNMGAGDAAVG